MPLIVGTNFRNTSSFVTDGSNETYVLPSDTYPTTRGGVTFGWETTGGLDARDRSSGADRRLAGIHFHSNTDTVTNTFRLDLLNPATHQIRLACGDAVFGNAQTNYLIVKDNATAFITQAPLATSTSELGDAAGNKWSVANWPPNNVIVERTFASTILRVTIGGSVDSNSSTIVHLFVEEIPSIGGSALFRGRNFPLFDDDQVNRFEFWPAVTQPITLSIQSASHAHTAQNLTLTQVHSLSIQNSNHAHTVGSLGLTQTHILAVQNASHAHAAPSLILNPLTTAILDDFNRTDEGPPPSASWGAKVVEAQSGLVVVDNQVTSESGTGSQAWGTTFGPDCEVYCEIPVTGGQSWALYLRANDLGTTVNGYAIRCQSNDGQMSIDRWDNGVRSTLGLFDVDFQDGDSVGGQVIGDVISAYHRPVGGEWILIGQRTDATYSGSGSIALQISSSLALRLDNFGGGTLGAVDLVIQDASHEHTAAAVTLTQSHSLVVQSSSHAHSAASLSFTQVHILTTQNGSHAHSAESMALTQAHNLTIANSSHNHTANNLLLTQAHVLVIAGSNHAHSTESPTLTQVHQLGIASATHPHTVGSLALTQEHTLATQNAHHAQVAANVELSSAGTLGIESTVLGHTAQNVVTTQAHALVIADSTHAHSAEQAAVTSTTNLVVQSSSHGHSVESLALTGAHNLSVGNASHQHSAGNVTLTQTHVLTIQGSSHSHTSQSITLIQTYQLGTANAEHAHAAESLTLTQVHVLTIRSGSHAQSAENLALSGEGILGIQSTSHAHNVPNVSLTQAHGLVVLSTAHGHSAENIALTELYNLNIQSAVHSHSAEGLAPSQAHVLTISDSAHGHLAQNLGLGLPDDLAISNSFHHHTARNISLTRPRPAGVFKVSAESRVLSIGVEGQAFVVSRENRTLDA